MGGRRRKRRAKPKKGGLSRNWEGEPPGEPLYLHPSWLSRNREGEPPGEPSCLHPSWLSRNLVGLAETGRANILVSRYVFILNGSADTVRAQTKSGGLSRNWEGEPPGEPLCLHP